MPDTRAPDKVVGVAQSFPVPIGVGVSFPNVQANVKTATFGLNPGLAVVTFQAVDPNNCGTATLYDDDDAVIVAMTAPGWYSFIVPDMDPAGGTDDGGYYFKATAGANILAATTPNILR